MREVKLAKEMVDFIFTQDEVHLDQLLGRFGYLISPQRALRYYNMRSNGAKAGSLEYRIEKGKSYCIISTLNGYAERGELKKTGYVYKGMKPLKRMGNLSSRILEVLRDGKEYSLDTLYEKLAEHIDPVRALDVYSKDRIRQKIRPKKDTQGEIRLGAKRILSYILKYLVRQEIVVRVSRGVYRIAELPEKSKK